ncbi:MAG: hypothetical protein KDK39_15905 [Leptospiraceae bacterium]|nr:hypothetical protein [Leptospiraceae bacterium]
MSGNVQNYAQHWLPLIIIKVCLVWACAPELPVRNALQTAALAATILPDDLTGNSPDGGDSGGGTPAIPYPLGLVTIAEVSWFGERYHATVALNTRNFSHASNLLLGPDQKLHFAYSNDGQVVYALSADKGANWTPTNVTSALATKASRLDLALNAAAQPAILAIHDAFDFDGNGTDPNQSRELFEAGFDGSNWNYQGVKKSWSWSGSTYGYVKYFFNGYSASALHINPAGDYQYLINEWGWTNYGNALHELSRTAGSWNAGYASVSYADFGAYVSNETNPGDVDAGLQYLFGSFIKSDGTVYAFYNRYRFTSASRPHEGYYRTRPTSGAWSAATYIGNDFFGLDVRIDQAGNIHILSKTQDELNLYYRKNFGAAELIATETNKVHDGSLFVDANGRVTAAWSTWVASGGGYQFHEIRYNERDTSGVWASAQDLTSGYTGFGKTAPIFVRGWRYDAWPARRQLVFCENYNDGSDKKRIMLYTFAN